MEQPDFENLGANYAVVSHTLRDDDNNSSNNDNKYFLPGSLTPRPVYFIDYSKVEIERHPNNDSTVKIPVFKRPLFQSNNTGDHFLLFILYFDFECDHLKNFYLRTWEIEPFVLSDIPTTHYFRMTDDHYDDDNHSKKYYLPDCFDNYYIDYDKVKFFRSDDGIIVPIYSHSLYSYFYSRNNNNFKLFSTHDDDSNNNNEKKKRRPRDNNYLEYIIKINFNPRDNGVASFTLKARDPLSNYSFKSYVTDSGMEVCRVKMDFMKIVRSITGRPENTKQQEMEIGREVLTLCRQLEERIKSAENVVRNYFDRILREELREGNVSSEDYELCKMVKNILFFNPLNIPSDPPLCILQ